MPIRDRDNRRRNQSVVINSTLKTKYKTRCVFSVKILARQPYLFAATLIVQIDPDIEQHDCVNQMPTALLKF